MNDPEGDGGRPDTPSTDDDAKLGARLDSLRERLAARRVESDDEDRGRRSADRRAYGLGLRLATDLVAGTLVGGAIGWFVDWWLGTSPWGLIVLLLLGVAAGILNAMRDAGLVRESPVRQNSAGKDDEE
jgi:ATP synthase protein I